MAFTAGAYKKKGHPSLPTKVRVPFNGRSHVRLVDNVLKYYQVTKHVVNRKTKEFQLISHLDSGIILEPTKENLMSPAAHKLLLEIQPLTHVEITEAILKESSRQHLTQQELKVLGVAFDERGPVKGWRATIIGSVVPKWRVEQFLKLGSTPAEQRRAESLRRRDDEIKRLKAKLKSGTRGNSVFQQLGYSGPAGYYKSIIWKSIKDLALSKTPWCPYDGCTRQSTMVFVKDFSPLVLKGAKPDGIGACCNICYHSKHRPVRSRAGASS
jgi:hypothetical protein